MTHRYPQYAWDAQLRQAQTGARRAMDALIIMCLICAVCGGLMGFWINQLHEENAQLKGQIGQCILWPEPGPGGQK